MFLFETLWKGMYNMENGVRNETTNCFAFVYNSSDIVLNLNPIEGNSSIYNIFNVLEENMLFCK